LSNDNSNEKIVNDVIEKLRNNYKILNEGEFNYELIIGQLSDSMPILIKKMEEEIQIVQNHPDSKKRFEIITNFLGRLENEKSFDMLVENMPEHDFLETKKSIQNLDSPFKNFKKHGESKDIELAKEALCKMYAHNYEDVCKSYLKLFARIITGKKIDSCGNCINIILKFEPEMQFILQYFIPQIRNSIDHNDQYFDHENKLMIFPDRDKIPIELTIEHLRIGCDMQIVNKVCFSAAEDVKRVEHAKVAQYYYEKTQEYCKILNLDFKQMVKMCASSGINLLQVHNVLEKKIKNIPY